MNLIFLFYRSDLAYFDGLSETILSAGLVKPKPGTAWKHTVKNWLK
jgi:nuclear pore complex protein Nup155